jgi:cytochrome P450
MTQEVHRDFADPAFKADPHPMYARWRQQAPVTRVLLPSGLTAWLVTRYDDARQALSDPRLSKATRPSTNPVLAAMSQHMLSADPPDHTRLRRLVSGAFTARRIEALRPRIEEITDDLLAAMTGRDRVDLIDAFAFPLPIQVICELLGVPAVDRDSFRAWTTAIVTGASATGEGARAMPAMAAYIRELIADRSAHPGDDLMSGLIGVRDAGDRLSSDELSSMVFLLLLAGHETTVNLIGNGVHLLLTERDRWDRLRADPGLLPSAIEEFLRFEGPVETSTYRYAREDLEIGGTAIRAGESVLVSLLAADRDEGRFPDPDELRLDRAQNPHLAFGHGIHYCLGAPLARLEGEIAFGRLLARFPQLRPAGSGQEVSWRPGYLLRGLTELPVVPGPAAAA